MKKNATLIIFSLLICLQTTAQNAYYDAVKLRSNMKINIDATTHDTIYFFDQQKITAVYQVLKNYSYKAENDEDIYENICITGQKNKYLCNYFPAAPASATNVSSIFSTIGNYNGSNLFNGLSQFLIERAKAEVNEAFFTRLKDFLVHYPEFETLFPNTNIFLSNYNSWEYANLLNTLQEALKKDLNQLPANLIKLKDIDIMKCDIGENEKECIKCQNRVQKIKYFFNTNDAQLLLAAFKVADGIVNDQKVPYIINSVTTPEFLLGFSTGNALVNKNLNNALQLMNIVSFSLASNETGKNYINTSQFKTLATDKILRNLYLGLIFQKIKIANNGSGIIFDNGNGDIQLTKLISTDRPEGLVAYIDNIYEQAKNLQTIKEQLKADKLAAKTDLSADYAAMIDATRQLLIGIRQISIIDSSLQIPEDINKFFTYTDQTLSVTNQIFNKNYNAAVLELLNMITGIMNRSGTKDNDVINFCNNFLKYGSFAANVVEAKNPEDVKAAIEAIALPVGSYTIKQKSAFNISVNAYVGYAWDFSKVSFNNPYANGVYAPIGFSFNLGSARPYGIPLTFFASVIDLGSFVSYNLQKSDTDEMKQEVRLESVFSPSAQFFIQLPKTPLTIGGGWRQTPKLFYTKEDNSFVPIQSKSVFNLSVLIDIPLFTLHNRPFATAK